MNKRYGWLIALLAVATLVGVGAFSYHAGVAHGIVESGRAIAGPGGAAPGVMWHRPWGFGFGFFPFFPLFFFILLWIFVLRGLFWHGGGWGRGYWYGNGGVPPGLEEWHRRAHAQPGTPPASGTST